MENLWKSVKLAIGSLYLSPRNSLPRASRTRPTLVNTASSLQQFSHHQKPQQISRTASASASDLISISGLEDRERKGGRLTGRGSRPAAWRRGTRRSIRSRASGAPRTARPGGARPCRAPHTAAASPSRRARHRAPDRLVQLRRRTTRHPAARRSSTVIAPSGTCAAAALRRRGP